jgi:hypothetical protein
MSQQETKYPLCSLDALRISDLLELQVAHLLDEQGKIRQRFWIKEKKRGKRQEVVTSESIREAPCGAAGH